MLAVDHPLSEQGIQEAINLRAAIHAAGVRILLHKDPVVAVVRCCSISACFLFCSHCCLLPSTLTFRSSIVLVHLYLRNFHLWQAHPRHLPRK